MRREFNQKGYQFILGDSMVMRGSLTAIEAEMSVFLFFLFDTIFKKFSHVAVYS